MFATHLFKETKVTLPAPKTASCCSCNVTFNFLLSEGIFLKLPLSQPHSLSTSFPARSAPRKDRGADEGTPGRLAAGSTHPAPELDQCAQDAEARHQPGSQPGLREVLTGARHPLTARCCGPGKKAPDTRQHQRFEGCQTDAETHALYGLPASPRLRAHVRHHARAPDTGRSRSPGPAGRGEESVGDLETRLAPQG